MFGYAAGDPREVRAAKVARRATAQARWPFLTTLDLSMLHNETQLASMVKDRTGNSREVADTDVHEWLVRQVLPGEPGQLSSIARWTDDGGAPGRSSAGRSA